MRFSGFFGNPENAYNVRFSGFGSQGVNVGFGDLFLFISVQKTYELPSNGSKKF